MGAPRRTLAAAILAASCTVLAPSFAAESASKLETGLAALEASDYATAEKELRAAAKGKDMSAATVALATGRYAEAATTAAAAENNRLTRPDAVAVHAEALARQGKSAEAIALLETVRAEPNAHRARLLLGQLYIDAGRRADARDPLMALISDYNHNAIKSNDAESLALVGRAAHLLRSARDANDAYNQAEKAGKPRVETLLYRAELFLDKYDPGHAEEVVRDALKIAPNNAAAHVTMAHVKL